ncbi:alpha/beta hydrolase [Weissella koreensis KACC 15510]|uniref:alpha/beta hydrolase n=1 Tax=Weissella koreensis TaxID=165096 RepID=UPI00021751EA|nr:alpha/beta hydrolase [Weissella koreensis]AEJ23388.1 alpha/beta hydrolase [Weissella koreensis KACC 15510]
MQVKNKSFHPWRWIISIILVIAIIFGAAGGYFFHVAEVRANKSFIQGKSIKAGAPLYQQQEDWKSYDKALWNLKAHDGTNLQGYYVKADQPTTKTALVIHGFGVDHQAMMPYAAMFHKNGYNVLLIDNRAAGKSGGKYIGYGFLEAQDAKEWTQKIVQENGNDSQIVVMGASLGGATTMMLSGMNPPKQVKAYVEDAGYNSISEELLFQANSMYHLPKWLAKPLVKVVSLYSKIFAGYSYKQGEVSQYLAKNNRPMMFIHGAEDSFVPTKFVYDNYRAQKGPKQLLVVPNAEHVKSYATLTKKYEQKVEKFLNNYIKQ